MVYVINKDGKPLMPCMSVIARLLLKQGKAKCIKRTPFTIKLLYQATDSIQNITFGIDPGSNKMGSAAVKDNGDVIYLSQIQVRNDITKKITRRAMYRRTRRNRKTRYRKPRWLNRANSKREGRLPPTVVSKINSHLKEIRFVKSILPVNKIILEIGSFDPHALKEPTVLLNKWKYQKGINYGYANTKAYVLDRDKHICQNCNGKSKDKRIEIHHIVERSKSGSDEESNLICLCKTCHDKVHNSEILLKKKGKTKGQLKHATQMNIIISQLLKILPEAKQTFGFITKEHRQLLGLPKEHCVDAVVIASQGSKVNFEVSNIIFKRCVADGFYQLSQGLHSERKVPKHKIQGFKALDKVKYLGNIYFIKSRHSTGYVDLMDVNGNKINLKPMPKFNKLKRLNARKSWLIDVLKF